MNSTKKHEPIKDLFELLCLKLNGFNKTDELFDFCYNNYTFTFTYRNNEIKLANNVDVYDKYGNFIDNFNLEIVNKLH